jgi:predicted nucleic acid-binding protein
MTARLFVDTNVLIYAHDNQADDRHAIAKRLLANLWRTGSGVLSTQVLQEFYVNVTRKIPTPLSSADARQVLHQYSAWPVVTLGPTDVIAASELEERHQISFWDALIVVAARRGGATTLLSEDLSTGQRLAGVRILNPFEATSDIEALFGE